MKLIVLNDQGGGVMVITDDYTSTLRANMKHHEPIILEPRSPDGGEPRVYENGIAPTLNTYGGGRECLASSEEPIVIQMSSTNNQIAFDGVMFTLTARMGTGGNQVNAVLVKEE